MLLHVQLTLCMVTVPLKRNGYCILIFFLKERKKKTREKKNLNFSKIKNKKINSRYQNTKW